MNNTQQSTATYSLHSQEITFGSPPSPPPSSTLTPSNSNTHSFLVIGGVGCGAKKQLKQQLPPPPPPPSREIDGVIHREKRREEKQNHKRKRTRQNAKATGDHRQPAAASCGDGGAREESDGNRGVIQRDNDVHVFQKCESDDYDYDDDDDTARSSDDENDFTGVTIPSMSAAPELHDNSIDDAIIGVSSTKPHPPLSSEPDDPSSPSRRTTRRSNASSPSKPAPPPPSSSVAPRLGVVLSGVVGSSSRPTKASRINEMMKFVNGQAGGGGGGGVKGSSKRREPSKLAPSQSQPPPSSRRLIPSKSTSSSSEDTLFSFGSNFKSPTLQSFISPDSPSSKKNSSSSTTTTAVALTAPLPAVSQIPASAYPKKTLGPIGFIYRLTTPSPPAMLIKPSGFSERRENTRRCYAVRVGHGKGFLVLGRGNGGCEGWVERNFPPPQPNPQRR